MSPYIPSLNPSTLMFKNFHTKLSYFYLFKNLAPSPTLGTVSIYLYTYKFLFRKY